MNKKILLIILSILVLILIGGGYYWKIKIQKSPEIEKSATELAAEDIQNIAASTSAGIGGSVSPDVTVPNVNPIKIDVNPYNKTNPFSNLKTNPFQ